jgi:hypothetical protein
MLAQQASSTRQRKTRKQYECMPLFIIVCSCMYRMLKENVKCVCLAIALCHIGLAVMCINVIYKCLSLDVDQQQDLGKPSLKIV